MISFLLLSLPLAGAALSVSFSGQTPANGGTVYNNLYINAQADGTDFANMTIYVWNSTGIVSQTNGSSPLAVNITGLDEMNYFFNSSAWDTSGIRYDSETREVSFVVYGLSQSTYYKENQKDLNTTAFGIVLMAIGLIAVIVTSINDISEGNYGYSGEGGEEW